MLLFFNSNLHWSAFVNLLSLADFARVMSENICKQKAKNKRTTKARFDLDLLIIQGGMLQFNLKELANNTGEYCLANDVPQY